MAYLINKLNTNVSMADNTIYIPVGEWKQVTEKDIGHSEVVDAIKRNWVELTAKKPPEAKPFQPNFEIQTSPIHGSLTFPTAKVPA